MDSARELNPVATSAQATPELEAIVVGAGFGGIGVAIQLQRLGIDSFVLLERSDDLGGTWHTNTYPGLTVDIASLTYSFSFEPNPNWSRMFAPGSELKAYANRVADKYGLRPFMRFGAEVERAIYDEQFFTLEGEMRHIDRCLREVKRRGVRSFEVRADANRAFVERMRQGLRHSIFVRGQCAAANSYYFDPNGEPSLLRPSTVVRAHFEHAHFPLRDYHFS